ncbi:MAG: FkbM family methyltransferase [Solirubrobacterales bacterium]
MTLATRHKTALARLAVEPVIAARRLAGRGPELETTRRGIRWHLDLREGIDFAIWLLGAFEPGTRRAYTRMIEPGDVVVDIGANVGAHTLQFATLVGDAGRVIAFEPTAFAFRKLEANLALNPDLAQRVTAVQAALVGAPGESLPAQLYSSWPLGSSGDLHPKHRGEARGTEGARAATLDELLREAAVERVDLLKIDVDGHECDVLRGAGETLRAHSPPILLELAPYIFEDAGSSVGELTGLIDEAGYALFEFRDSRALPSDPERLAGLVPDGGSINAVARRTAHAG